MQQQQQQHAPQLQRAALFDTPTPPSQSYSSGQIPAFAGSGSNPLQTSLKPRGFSAAAGGGPTPFKKVTSTPAAGLAARQKSKVDREMDLDYSNSDDMDSTFTTSDFGGAGGGINNIDENVDPRNASVGLGNYGNGLGMADKQRFMDLHGGQATARKTARVDEHSDASSRETDADHRSSASSSEDDDLVARLGMGVRQGRQGLHQNVSKSAFDGMARELRKEFERIMESGKKQPVQAHTASPAQAQQSRYSLQAPSMQSNAVANPVALPRGVPPPSKQHQQQQQRASPMSHRTAYAAAQPMQRRDRTPTTVRTFGQELHAPRQASIPSPRFAISPKTALKQPLKAYQALPTVSYATSPFHAPSAAPAVSGLLPPNDTRATTKSASPVLVQQQQSSSHALSPPLIRRTASAAGTSSPYHVRVPDITGLTEGLTSPSRVVSGPSSHRELPRDRSRTISLGRSQEGESTSTQLPCLRYSTIRQTRPSQRPWSD